MKQATFMRKLMPDSRLRILIAESNVLIALDLERILVEAYSCEVTVVTFAALSDSVQHGKYDIAMIEAVLSPRLNAERATVITNSGTLLVFLSSFDDFTQAFPTLARTPVISKPYDPALVIEVIEQVSRRET